MAGLSKVLFNALLAYMGPRRLFRQAAQARRAELQAMLEAGLGRTVQAGPFAGMKLPTASSWGDGDRVTKLLGLYECNLYPLIERARTRAPRTVINVGCAEGFFAVGLARLLPEAKVYAFDLDPAAVRVCRQAAEDNGVGDRVEVAGECDAETLGRLLSPQSRALVFMDCEGAEAALLDPAKAPGLAGADILVECHDFVDRTITATLRRRFEDTHVVETVAQGGRDPHIIPQLASWQELDRWLMVDEGRPESMHWLACWSGGRHAP